MIPGIPAVRLDHIDLRFEYAIVFVECVLGLHWRSKQRHIAIDQTHGALNTLLLIVHTILHE